MLTLKFKVEDRRYSQYSFVDSQKLTPVEIDLDPSKHKLFNQDVFEVENGKFVNIAHSSVRSMKNIPGVLVLEGNKIYGKRKGKNLYRCVPDDKRMPEFLISYSLKISYNKNIKNKYLIFEFLEWKDKHPIATIIQVFGDVSVLDNFYEYQLYCKSLYASIKQFNKAAMKCLRDKSEEYYIETIKSKYEIENREGLNVFTIDPKNCKDFDDAVSIIEKDGCIVLSIYISNVIYWLEELDLWDSFSKRIATIYLPDRKRPMLPTILSEALCSLTQGNTRFAFTLDIKIDKSTYQIIGRSFTNTSVIVKNNFVYDSKEQETHPDYVLLFDTINCLSVHHTYLENINTSHDVIAYMMIMMNNICAKELVESKLGIYRSFKMNVQYKPPEYLSGEVKKFLKIWNSNGSRYCKFNDFRKHDMLKLESYIHITSPIRRLVDLLSMMIFLDNLGLFDFTEKSKQFYDYWYADENLEYINTTMLSIRKVQNDCNLLNLCVTDEKIMKEIYDGIIFNKIIRSDSLYQYMVYLPKLKMVNRFTSRYDKDVFGKEKFKIYVFVDEVRLKQKIRVDMLDK